MRVRVKLFMREKLRQIFKYIKRAVLICVGIAFLVHVNLTDNMVYYASHLPHKEGTYPLIALTVDSLYDCERPDDGTYKYDFDGGPCIIIPKEDGWCEYLDHYGTNFCFSESKHVKDDNRTISYEIHYEFNDAFQLISAHGEKTTCDGDMWYTEQLPTLSEQEVIEKINTELQPLVDYNLKNVSLLNLQFLFNMIYGPRFN